LSSTIRDKEELITQLTQFRQQEIRAIVEVGKTSRQQLRDHSERIFREYSHKIHAELEEMKTNLSTTNLEADVRNDQTRVQTLSKESTDRIHELLSNITKRLPDVAREKVSVIEGDLVDAQSEVKALLDQQLSKMRADLEVIGNASAAKLEQSTSAQQLKF